METELKFQVPRAQRQALRRAVGTASAVTTRLQAVYADTPGQDLAAAGLALRMRKEGRVWVQTLKGRGDGLMQRLEHEVHLPPQRGVPVLDPQRHGGTAAGDRLQKVLARGAPLQPVYSTDIRRLHRRLRHAGALIEVAYDRGHIIAGARRLVVNEIEFELVRGPAAALPDLAARWAARFGLWWDVRTKSERGFRLALGCDTVPPVLASSRPMPSVRRGAAPAWQTRLQGALLHALPNAAELASCSGHAGHLAQWCAALQRLRQLLGRAPAGLQPQGCMQAAAQAHALIQALAQPGRPSQAQDLQAAGAAARSTASCLLMLQCLAWTMAPAAKDSPAP